MKNKAIKPKGSDVGLIIFAYVFIAVISVSCLLPFLLILSGSFTAEKAVIENGFTLIPSVFSTEAYSFLLESGGSILNAYGVTIFVTAVGTLLSVSMMCMAAFVLQSKDFHFRSQLALYFYITTVFSGGIVPWYILIVRYLGMKNSLAALIVPSLFNVFNMIVLRSFISSIPDSITESAKIDGASNFKVFSALIMPLSKPAIATMCLFVALAYWNDWFNAMLFISDDKKIPLQYYLYSLLTRMDFLKNMAASRKMGTGIYIDPPSETIKMATTIVTIGPIALLYPFLQKYFIKGIMIGAVKG